LSEHRCYQVSQDLLFPQKLQVASYWTFPGTAGSKLDTEKHCSTRCRTQRHWFPLGVHLAPPHSPSQSHQHSSPSRTHTQTHRSPPWSLPSTRGWARGSTRLFLFYQHNMKNREGWEISEESQCQNLKVGDFGKGKITFSHSLPK